MTSGVSPSSDSAAAPRSAGRKRVVIVGAGFAGLNAVHELDREDVEITLVDRNNFHTFQPLLYQVATSYLPPEQVGATLRTIFRRQKNLQVRVGTVTSVDFDGKRVHLQDGGELPYDYLVLSAGATTNFFGISGMEEYSWPLYTMGDAVRLRLHLLEQLEAAAAEPAKDPSRATVVVVGGGPTGVETAGALAEMGKDHIGGDVEMRVILVELLPRLLNTFSESSSRQALKDLQRRGVDVRLGAAVEAADAEGVQLKGGERIATRTVVWGAGVQANPLGRNLGLETGRGGSIVVGPDLRVPGKDGVFAIGDLASIQPPPPSGPPPLVAPNAIQQGKHTGQQIKRLLAGEQTEPYSYFNKGILAVIARGDAVAELPVPGLQKRTVKAKGFPAWALWAGVHIVYLVGFRNRLKTLTDWLWNFVLTGGGGGGILVRATRSPRPEAT